MKSPYLLLIDSIACRYGVLPSQLLEMGVDELNWNIKIFSVAVEKENIRLKQKELEIKSRTRRG